MKTSKFLRFLAGLAAGLPLAAATSSAQVFDSVESLKNPAIAASPRAREAFPWLLRTAPSSGARQTRDAAGRNALVDARRNAAVASSPRTLELFPELTPWPEAHPEFTLAPLVERSPALQANPRFREEFPALDRSRSPNR